MKTFLASHTNLEELLIELKEDDGSPHDCTNLKPFLDEVVGYFPSLKIFHFKGLRKFTIFQIISSFFNFITIF